jgi:hypothetical protein
MFAFKQLPHLLNLQTISDVFGGSRAPAAYVCTFA